MLRYWRKPGGLDHERGLPAHRAFPDAYVTAHILCRLLQKATVAELIPTILAGLKPLAAANA